MKKIVLGIVLLTGISLVSMDKADAAAYVGDTQNITISSESNQKAIQILKENGALEKNNLPLDKLTTNNPLPSKFFARASLKSYYPDGGSRYIANMWQMQCTELAPVGFDWIDNGIPTAVANINSNTARFTFKTNMVSDTGVGMYDRGYYWRNINTPYGSFWASVWNLNDLLY